MAENKAIVGMKFNLNDVKKEIDRLEKTIDSGSKDSFKALEKIEKAYLKNGKVAEKFALQEKKINEQRDRALKQAGDNAKKRAEIEKRASKQIIAIRKKHQKEIESALKKSLRKQESLTKKSVKKQGDTFKKMGDRVKSVMVGMAAAAGIRSGITALNDFSEAFRKTEKQVAQIETLLRGTGDVKYLTQIQEQAQKTALETGTSIDEILQGAYQAISAGAANASNVGEFMDLTSKFALGIGSDTEAAALAVGGALNSVGWGAERAGEMMDILSQTMTKGVIPSGQALAKEFPQVAGAFTDLGFSANEYGAALASMTGQGRQLNMSVTMLKALAMELQNPATLKNLEKLRKEGLLGFDFEKRIITDTQAFMKSMSDIASVDKNLIKDVFGSQEAKVAADLLFRNTEKGLLNMSQGFEDVSGATQYMFQTMAATGDVEMKKTQQRMEMMGRNIGETWAKAQSGFNQFLFTIFSRSDEKFKIIMMDLDRINERVLALDEVIGKGLEIETDFTVEGAENFAIQIREILPQIEEMSGAAARSIKGLLDAAESGDPTAIKGIREELEGIRDIQYAEKQVKAIEAVEVAFAGAGGTIFTGWEKVTIAGEEWFDATWQGTSKIIESMDIIKKQSEDAQKAYTDYVATSKALGIPEEERQARLKVLNDEANKQFKNLQTAQEIQNKTIDATVTLYDSMNGEIDQSNDLIRANSWLTKEATDLIISRVAIQENEAKTVEIYGKKQVNILDVAGKLQEMYTNSLVTKKEETDIIEKSNKEAEKVLTIQEMEEQLGENILALQGSKLHEQKAEQKLRISQLKLIKAELDAEITRLKDLIKGGQAVIEVDKERERINSNISKIMAGQVAGVAVDVSGGGDLFEAEKLLAELEESSKNAGDEISKLEGDFEDAAKGAKTAEKAFEDTQKALSDMSKEAGDIRFETSLIGVDDFEASLATEKRSYEQHLVELRSQYGNNQAIMAGAEEVYQAKVTQLWAHENRKRQEDALKRNEEARKKDIERMKQVEQARIQAAEQASKRIMEIQKKRNESLLRAMEALSSAVGQELSLNMTELDKQLKSLNDEVATMKALAEEAGGSRKAQTLLDEADRFRLKKELRIISDFSAKAVEENHQQVLNATANLTDDSFAVFYDQMKTFSLDSSKVWRRSFMPVLESMAAARGISLREFQRDRLRIQNEMSSLEGQASNIRTNIQRFRSQITGSENIGERTKELEDYLSELENVQRIMGIIRSGAQEEKIIGETLYAPQLPEGFGRDKKRAEDFLKKSKIQTEDLNATWETVNVNLKVTLNELSRIRTDSEKIDVSGATNQINQLNTELSEVEGKIGNWSDKLDVVNEKLGVTFDIAKPENISELGFAQFIQVAQQLFTESFKTVETFEQIKDKADEINEALKSAASEGIEEFTKTADSARGKIEALLSEMDIDLSAGNVEDIAKLISRVKQEIETRIIALPKDIEAMTSEQQKEYEILIGQKESYEEIHGLLKMINDQLEIGRQKLPESTAFAALEESLNRTMTVQDFIINKQMPEYERSVRSITDEYTEQFDKLRENRTMLESELKLLNEQIESESEYGEEISSAEDKRSAMQEQLKENVRLMALLTGEQKKEIDLIDESSDATEKHNDELISGLNDVLGKISAIQGAVSGLITAFSQSGQSASGMVSAVTGAASSIAGQFGPVGQVVGGAIGIAGSAISGVMGKIEEIRAEASRKLQEKMNQLQKDLVGILSDQLDLINMMKSADIDWISDITNQMGLLTTASNEFASSVIEAGKRMQELSDMSKKEVAMLFIDEGAAGAALQFEIYMRESKTRLINMVLAYENYGKASAVFYNQLTKQGIDLETANAEDLIGFYQTIDDMQVDQATKDKLKELTKESLEYLKEQIRLQKEAFDQEKSQSQHRANMLNQQISGQAQLLGIIDDQLIATKADGSLLYIGEDRNALLEERLSLERDITTAINEQREAITALQNVVFTSDIAGAQTAIESALSELSTAMDISNLGFDDMNENFNEIISGISTIISGGGDVDFPSIDLMVNNMEDYFQTQIDQVQDVYNEAQQNADLVRAGLEGIQEAGLEESGITAAVWNLLVEELRTLDSIASEKKDILDLAQQEISTNQELIDTYNEILEPLRQKAEIEYRLAENQHNLNMGMIDQSEFEARRLELLEEELALLEEQEAIDPGNQYLIERWKLEEEIYKLTQDQTDEMLKQGQISDSELDRLIRKRQMMIEQARESGTITDVETQADFAAIEASIRARLVALGMTPEEIASAIQAMTEQRSYAVGGRVDSGVSMLHDNEAVLPSSSVSMLDSINPQIVNNLIGATSLSDLPEIMKYFQTSSSPLTQNAISNLSRDSINSIYNSYTSNTVNAGNNTFNVQGSGNEGLVKMFKAFEMKMPEMVVKALQTKGVKYGVQ